MKAIQITVAGTEASVTEKPVLTSGTVGLPVEFIFDEAWDGLGKTAVFRAGSRSYPGSCVQDAATVPWEVLEKPGVGLYIGIFGADAAGTIKIPTIWAFVDTITPGTQIPDTVPEAPTPSVYDQILAAAHTAVETAASVREDADAGAFIGPVGPKGDAGAIDFVIVTELPAIGDDSKIYLMLDADGEEPNRFGEYVFVEGAWERIGSAGVEVNLEEYVKHTDYASSSKGGVVKTGTSAFRSKGIYISSEGILALHQAKNDEIEAKSNVYFPITPNNLDYAVKTGITTNTIELTDGEKATACSWIGAIAKEEWFTIANMTLAEDTEKVLITTDAEGNAFRCKKARVILKVNGAFSQSDYTTWISFMEQANGYVYSCRFPLGTILNGTNQRVYVDNEVITEGVSKGVGGHSNANSVARVGANSYIGCIEINLNNNIPLPAGLTIVVEGVKE